MQIVLGPLVKKVFTPCRICPSIAVKAADKVIICCDLGCKTMKLALKIKKSDLHYTRGITPKRVTRVHPVAERLDNTAQKKRGSGSEPFVTLCLI